VEPVVGVDGCGVPVHGMPLSAVATMYARLGDPDRQGALAPGMARAIGAMRAAPYLVGGRGRDDTVVMQEVPGVVMKEGAEALDCVALLDRRIGVAVKVADGGERAAGPTMIAILDRIGMLDRSALASLTPRARPVVTGGGEPVGRIEVLTDLRFTDRGGAAFAREARNIG
jgi:L-asparaginase II